MNECLQVWCNLRIAPGDVPLALKNVGFEFVRMEYDPDDDEWPYGIVIRMAESKGCETMPGWCPECDVVDPCQRVVEAVGVFEGKRPRLEVDFTFHEI
jgi:hypothetical protein